NTRSKRDWSSDVCSSDLELMLENTEELARIMTLEMGKPINESRGEVKYAASFIEWFAEEAKRMYGDTIPAHVPGKRLQVWRKPVDRKSTRLNSSHVSISY